MALNRIEQLDTCLHSAEPMLLQAASTAREAVTRLDIVALATLAGILGTAIATAFLAWKTTNLAVATERMATAATAGIELQRDELAAVKDQLELAHSDFTSRRRAAIPRLQATEGSRVEYTAGSDPAYGVYLWVRDANGYRSAALGVMTPVRAVVANIATREILDDEVKRHWPFPELIKPLDLNSANAWIGVTWTISDEPPLSGWQWRKLAYGQLVEEHWGYSDE